MTGILLFVGTLAMSFWASWRVKSTYRKFSQYTSASGLTGEQVAAKMLRENGIHDVEIVPVEGELTDHYDPTQKRLALSAGNYSGNSIAAIGVAAHECGHAIQHARAYGPLHWRLAAVGVTSFASGIGMWLPMIGMATGLLRPYTGLMMMAVIWGIIMAFNLVTLPVEFDATARAKKAVIDMGIIQPGPEQQGMNRVLDAAAFTYVAAFLTSLLYFLWHLLPLLTGGRRSD